MVLRLATLCLFAAVWGGLLFGASQLHRYDLGLGHGVCGPWGCAASTEALLGANSLWTLILVPIAVSGCAVGGPVAGWRIGLGMSVVGFAGALLLVAAGSASWWMAGEPTEYLLQRGLFVLASTPDLPVIPVALAGLAGMAVSRIRRSEGVEASGPGGENQGSAVDAAAPVHDASPSPPLR